MNLPLFIARHIYGNEDGHRKVSRPAIKIATIGVAIGLAVMIVTVSVVLGFKHTIRAKVVGFGSHIQLANVRSVIMSADGYSVCIGDSLLRELADIDGVSHAARVAMAQGILKTDDDFLGVLFKGVGPEYDTSFLGESLVDGQLPAFCDTASSYPVVVSKSMADKLHLAVGDRIHAYFIGYENVRTRRFTVSAVYQTNMKRFDDLVCITDIFATQKLNGWTADECSGAELQVGDFSRLDEVNRSVALAVKGQFDANGNLMAPQTITSVYPQVFSWLDLLDINVWIILVLMIAVAGITMISGLLIIILERTQMIGILKALGARNATVRHTFLWFAVFIVGRGMIWGNVVGVCLVLLQQHTGIITLDPQTYYVSQAPMELNVPLIVLLNGVTLLTCLLVLVGPSYLVSHIRPSRSMRYE